MQAAATHAGSDATTTKARQPACGMISQPTEALYRLPTIQNDASIAMNLPLDGFLFVGKGAAVRAAAARVGAACHGGTRAQRAGDRKASKVLREGTVGLGKAVWALNSGRRYCSGTTDCSGCLQWATNLYIREGCGAAAMHGYLPRIRRAAL